MDKPVVVIGAGIGGLSAAIHLAAAGQRVVILEQNPAVGGKMGEMRSDGFRWDTGPSVITMRHVFDELFASLGGQLEDYLTLTPVEPLTRYFYADGTQLDVSRDWPKMAAQIQTLDERDVEGYLAYLSYAARLHRLTGSAFIYGPPPGLQTFRQVSPLDIFKIDGLRSMDRAASSFVRSPHLRQMLGRFATYVGASPYLAPATLNVIAHVELTGGVWYPRGGIYSIARALERLAGESGVEIRTDCAVQRIEVKDKVVQGVILDDETRLAARAVVANVDVATVYERLLPADAAAPNRSRALTSAEPSCSGFIMLLGIEGQDESLAHHNIFFSPDYPREFQDIYERGVPPDDPTVYLAITSKTDAADAPEGSENWFVLVNAPPLGPGFDWQKQAEAYGDRVLTTLARFGLEVQGRIRSKHILTPLDLERLTGARRGALYGASSNSRFAAFRRPSNRAPDVRGLYFCGGTTHPGGGVPMVTLSGRVAAQMLLEDLHKMPHSLT